MRFLMTLMVVGVTAFAQDAEVAVEQEVVAVEAFVEVAVVEVEQEVAE